MFCFLCSESQEVTGCFCASFPCFAPRATKEPNAQGVGCLQAGHTGSSRSIHEEGRVLCSSRNPQLSFLQEVRFTEGFVSKASETWGTQN